MKNMDLLQLLCQEYKREHCLKFVQDVLYL
jgi:hypothetical protein